MSNTALDILVKARDLISNPDKWTQGSVAKDEYGDDVIYDDPTACRFCSVGAIHLFGKVDFMDCHEAKSVLKEQMNFSIPKFNDTHNHKDVIAAFDRAIFELKGKNG